MSKRCDSRGLEQESTIFDHLVFQYFVVRNCLSKTSEVSPILESKVSNLLALSVCDSLCIKSAKHNRADTTRNHK